MTSSQIPTGSIVLAYDGSPHADDAMTWVLTQAALEGQEVDLVHALGPAETQAAAWAGAEAGTVLESIRLGALTMVQQAVTRAEHLHPSVIVRGHVLEADPRSCLHELSSSAHLIVLGSRGRGSLRTLLLGSVSATVSAHAACPVVVVRPRSGRGGDTPTTPTDRPSHAGGVVVAADGTRQSLPVLDFAFLQATLHSMPITVVHFYPEDVWGTSQWAQDEIEQAEARLLRSMAAMATRYPDVETTTRLERGAVRRVLPGSDWDLVVVGRHDRSRLDRLLSGSTAQSVLQHARTTVAVVPEGPVDQLAGDPETTGAW